uniref:RRM domain-containing protein n=1 Tax=Eutreptiella gymnastica TaxID=73025 RepID=A0A7S1IKR4_9EUGL
MFLGQCPDPDTAAVKAHYQRLGEDAIDRVHWCHRDNDAFRGFGFVYFRTAEFLQQAGAMDPPTINGRVTVVDINSGFNNGRANRIVLSGCPSTIEESDIKSHYARALGDAALTSVTWATMPDGHVRAFLQFSTAQFAKQAAELEPPIVDGQPLRVCLRDKSADAAAAQTGPDGKPVGPTGSQKEYKMFIRNCPQWIEDKHILDHYTPLIGEGVIQKIEWATSRLDGSFRGFGFAFFNSLEDLTKAAKHPPPVVDGRKVEVNVSHRSI